MLDPSAAASEGLITGGGSGDGDFASALSSQSQERTVPHLSGSWASIQGLSAGRELAKLAGQFPRDALQGDTVHMLHYLSPVLSQQGQHSLGQIFCHTPGHKTHFLASDLENNTLRGMTFLAALPELNVLSMSLATPTCSPEEARSG